MNAIQATHEASGYGEQPDHDVVALKDRAALPESFDEPAPDNFVEAWVQKIHWEMQRSLLLGEGEETTGVVKVEILEL